MSDVVPRCRLCDTVMARSHSRTFGERLLKLFIPLRPHRCTNCGARAWRRPAPPGDAWYPDPRDRGKKPR